MATAYQPKNLGDLLKHEGHHYYSRDQETVAAGQNLALGTVVGKKSLDGKLYALNPTANDGTEIAIGVLANDVDATLVDKKDAVLIARHAIVASNALIWPNGITAQQKATAIAQLKSAGVLVRDNA